MAEHREDGDDDERDEEPCTGQLHGPGSFKNVPLNTRKTWAQFPQNDFSALPDLSFVVPNQCNDMHSCSVNTGDTWTRNNLG